jgi:hypothetical protein
VQYKINQLVFKQYVNEIITKFSFLCVFMFMFNLIQACVLWPDHAAGTYFNIFDLWESLYVLIISMVFVFVDHLLFWKSSLI